MDFVSFHIDLHEPHGLWKARAPIGTPSIRMPLSSCSWIDARADAGMPVEVTGTEMLRNLDSDETATLKNVILEMETSDCCGPESERSQGLVQMR